MKAKHSYKDSKGILWVACSECDRGSNGDDKEKCSCGCRSKKFNGLGCFIGTLMSKYETQEILMSKNRILTIELSEEINNGIIKLTEKDTKNSKIEALRSAIALYLYLCEEQKKGHKIVITNSLFEHIFSLGDLTQIEEVPK